ncbi:MAG: hypothetical protein GY801_16410 [bacterium]|nr:hypothetical protein [bacterium]
MDHDVEIQLLQEIDALKRKVQLLEGHEKPPLPTYQYSKIRDRDLKQLFQIDQVLAGQRFDAWFQHPFQVDDATIAFLSELLEDNTALIERYSEEDLKINFIAPLLKKVRFKSFEKQIRDYYELPMTYATERFVLSGTVDFVVSEGLLESKKPYFFIQEFKRSEEYGNPRPQLLAELISATELNGWKEMKGAYIFGASWHFAILEKIADSTYQYVLSSNFDSTKLDDLCAIYKHLVTVKHEILGMVT